MSQFQPSPSDAPRHDAPTTPQLPEAAPTAQHGGTRPPPVTDGPVRPAFQPRQHRPQPTTPRKVIGGIRLLGKQSPAINGWAGRRWMRCVEEAAPAERFAVGLELARTGQTRELRVAPGGVGASVQDKEARPWPARLEVGAFREEDWARVFEAMATQAIYAAKLLAGQTPVNVEDIFAPLDLRLFPAEPGDIKPSCECDESRAEDGSNSAWCRHACCAAILMAERVDADPFLVWAMRGMTRDELANRLRRPTGRAVEATTAAYEPRPVTGAESGPPLEGVLDEFWSLPPAAEAIETALRPPAVKHALLKRLGPSPLEGKFPLSGLLATCYDLVSEEALKSGDAGPDGQADPA